MKVTKKQLLKQYKLIQLMEIRTSLESQKLEVMLREVFGVDMGVYRVNGNEIEIRESEYSLPVPFEKLLSKMEE